SAPDLIGRAFTAEVPNTKWCGDITYVKTWDGWAYLASVIDLAFRRVAVGSLLAAGRRDVSLVDWVSFELMRRLKITRAFAFDPDFEAQGLRTVT
ncbi:MAG: hypothetical protein M3Z84_00445, partial [Actinomycetota bacterium]|nr:hypothetical protein [Actinomycetota bacterium]